MIRIKPQHFLLSLALLVAASGARAWGLDELMASLAAQKGGRATFVEKKYIGVIDKPVESSGELVFRPPDHLEKRTTAPRAETLQLDGRTLVIERAGKSRLQLRIDDYMEAQAFVDSIRGTLAGDRSALEKNFELTLSGTPAAWRLILTPRYTRLTMLVTHIEMRGQQGQIKRIDFELADGDRSEMSITRVETP